MGEHGKKGGGGGGGGGVGGNIPFFEIGAEAIGKIINADEALFEELGGGDGKKGKTKPAGGDPGGGHH